MKKTLYLTFLSILVLLFFTFLGVYQGMSIVSYASILFMMIVVTAVFLRCLKTLASLKNIVSNIEDISCGKVTPISHDGIKTKEIKDLVEKINTLIVTFRNVCEELRKKVVEKTDEIIETKDYLENLVSSSPDAIMTTDMDGFITFLSKGAEELTGYTFNEVSSIHFSILFSDGYSETEKINELFAKEGKVENYETKYRAKTGKIITIIFTMTRLMDRNMNVVGLLCHGKDITELKKLQLQIQRSEKLAAVGQLASGIAHEIGTPLNVISGSAEYLLMHLHDGSSSEEDLHVIVSQAQRIARLIEQLLNFSRSWKPKFEPVAIEDIVREVLQLAKHQLAKSNIDIHVEIEKGLPVIMADSDRIQQVFLNLVINAWHAMESGGSLTIAARKSSFSRRVFKNFNGNERWIEIEFTDSGCGISEKNRELVFNPFFSTKDISKGTGLGLAVCHKIIEEHNGEIELESEENKGTTFIIRLPVKQ